MVCLIRSKNKPLLDSYTDIIGSEDAAYYVLSKNNGYSLEFTPSGERSDLFRQLLAKNNYDYQEAIREKAEMYYSSYYDELGGDWTTTSLDSSVIDDNGEPRINYTPEEIDFAGVLSPEIKFDQTDYMNLAEIDYNSIKDDMYNHLGDINNLSAHEVHNKKTQWLKDKQKKLVDSINSQLLKAFGLEKKTDKDGNAYFVSKEKDESGRYKVIVQFCEYIEGGHAGVYDQSGRLEAAANLIQISLTNADATTFNHELAHHYVRMFWNSEIIQKLAQKLDTGDRSHGWQVRLEERIVGEITANTVEVSGFWNKLTDMISTAFKWLSSPVKQSLLRKASLAFRLNDQAISLRQEQRVLQFIDPTAKRVFQNLPNPLVVEFENTFRTFGIKEAANQFIKDSIQFFEQYSQNPNSILKDQYNEYVEHFKNTLKGLNISDQDFNEVVILINDYERDTARQYSNPADVHRACADSIVLCIEEIRRTRIAIRNSNNTNTGLSTQQQQSSQNRDKILAKVIEDIILSLKTRIYEYIHTVPKEAQKSNEVNQIIEKLNLIAENDKKLAYFIAYGTDELAQLYNQLNSLAANRYNSVTTQQLMLMWTTVDGFYKPIIDLIYNEIAHDEYTIVHNGILQDVGVKLQNMQSLCSIIGSKLTEANKIISERETHEYLLGADEEQETGAISDLLTDQQKERFLSNFDDQLIIGQLFEDINMLQPYIGLASRSRSLVIRVARNMILNANRKIRQATLKDVGHIITLYWKALPEMRKLGLKELQSVFQELDEKGIPTGYFVRKLNHGKFYRQLDEYKEQLVNIANEKLKQALGQNAPQITYDYFNNPILPIDDDQRVKDILKEYSDNLDEWLCEHSDRMFVPEYYRMRRLMLSPNTRQTLSNIQSRINQLMSKCPIVKVTDSSGKEVEMQATWELSPEDQQNLIQLRNEYQQLGNQYYSDGTMKSGEELDMALEIQRFNKWKGEHVKYNQNDQRFNAAIEEIRKKHGPNSIEESRFRKLNTTLVINPTYYEYVLSKLSLLNNPQLDSLRQKRNDLKKLIEDFDKKGIDVEQKRRQLLYWDQLKDVDRQITELIQSISQHEDNEEKMWSTYFDKEPVMYDENTTLLDHMLQQDIREYRNTHPADTRSDRELRGELVQKYQYTYTWYDKQGQPHEGVALVSVFNRYTPKGASINNGSTTARFTINGRSKKFPNAVITRYSQQFSDIDPESEFYNKDYDRTSSAFVQPKSSEYQNDSQWSLIENNENIHKLYDALVQLMHDNYSKLPNTNADSYRLPQITGRRLTILRRSSSLKELCDALQYNWENEWQLNERDDSDINYEDEKIRIRADGTRINTVPTRYLTPKDGRVLTSDVIGSIIAFTEMANNFVVKTQLSSELESIKRQLMDREDYGIAERHNKQSTKNIVKQLTNIMDDQLYGNTTKLGDKITKFGKKQQMLIKFVTHFQHLGRKLMLGFNFTSMHVGFWESAIRGMLEAFLGKDYTLRDFRNAWKKITKHGPNTLKNVGGFRVTNLMVAKMQHFGVSKSIKDSYHSTERNRFVKLLSENIDGMFGFSLGDYTNSAFQLTMALSNVRFIEGDSNIKTGFYTKLTLIRAYQKAGMSFRQAKRTALLRYNQSTVSLDDAYELKEGHLEKKQEYAKYITDHIENRITGKCYQRLAEALGIVPQGDNPGYGLQVLLRPFGTLRTYMFTVIARNWNYAHDFQRRYLDEHGNVVKENDMIDGYLDIDAGNMNIALHQGLYEWMKMIAPNLPLIGRIFKSVEVDEEAREIYNYAAKKVLLEILSIVSLVGISTLFKALSRGADDDDWWQRFGYLTSVRLVNSFISVLDPTSLLEIIKNISTLISPLNDLINAITTLSDVLGLSGHSPMEEIKSGSYKGHTRLFRNLMRMTPLGNAYEDFSPSALKSRTNWYLQQDPLVWSSVGGVFDQLWGTDSEGIKTKKK